MARHPRRSRHVRRRCVRSMKPPSGPAASLTVSRVPPSIPKTRAARRSWPKPMITRTAWSVATPTRIATIPPTACRTIITRPTLNTGVAIESTTTVAFRSQRGPANASARSRLSSRSIEPSLHGFPPDHEGWRCDLVSVAGRLQVSDAEGHGGCPRTPAVRPVPSAWTRPSHDLARRGRRGADRRDNADVEPLPASARMPPAPPRPPAPPTTGWMDRPGGSQSRPPVQVAPRLTIAGFFRQCLGELRKIIWPSGRAVRNNAIVMFLTVITLMAALGAVELAVGRLAGDLFS